MSVTPPSSPALLSAPIDLQRVSALFARTGRLAAAAFLRREIANRMHERLDLIKLAPQQVLDAGCGDGADLLLLQQRFEAAQLTGVDISDAQLTQAQHRLAQAQSGLQRAIGKWLPKRLATPTATLVQADFAHLPVAAQSLDLLWSNLALHWHPQPDLVLREWQRCIRPEGLLMFSCFGPDTLRQVRTAFAAAGMPDGRCLPFVDMHDLGDMLVQAGFAAPVMDMEMITVTYSEVKKMLSELRALGGNPLENRAKGLLGRHAWQRVLQNLQQQCDREGKYCLSFEVIYGHAFRPLARKNAAGEAIIQFTGKAPKA